MNYPGKYASILMIAFGVVISPAVVRSQEGSRVFQEQLRSAIDRQQDAPQEREIDGGGWLNIDLLNYNDVLPDRDRTLRRYQLRGWFKFNIDDIHTGYFRGLLRYDDWDGSDNPSFGRGDDFDARVERAWYRFDLGKFLSSTGHEPPVGFVFKVGRDFMSIGSALVLSRDLDHIRFDITAGDFQFMGFFGMSVRDSMNYDQSPLVYNRSERCYYGFELKYDNHGNHRPYAYFLSSNDHTTPSNSFTRGQRFDYSPRYLGIGSEGTLLPDLTYRAELVGQWGRAFSERSTLGWMKRDEICAMAANLQLEYLFRVPTNPRVRFEYMYASGDGDRRISSSSTVGGNRQGTTDKAFNAAGFRDTGIAFAPLLSNIHIYCLGFRCFPLENYDLFKRMEVGTNLFFYHKDKAGGPISDPTALDRKSVV